MADLSKMTRKERMAWAKKQAEQRHAAKQAKDTRTMKDIAPEVAPEPTRQAKQPIPGGPDVEQQGAGGVLGAAAAIQRRNEIIERTRQEVMPTRQANPPQRGPAGQMPDEEY